MNKDIEEMPTSNSADGLIHALRYLNQSTQDLEDAVSRLADKLSYVTKAAIQPGDGAYFGLTADIDSSPAVASAVGITNKLRKIAAMLDALYIDADL